MTRDEFATLAAADGLTYEAGIAALEQLVLRARAAAGDLNELAIEAENEALAWADRDKATFFQPFTTNGNGNTSGRGFWRRCPYCHRGFWAKVSWARFCPGTRHKKYWHRRERRRRERAESNGRGLAEAA